ECSPLRRCQPVAHCAGEDRHMPLVGLTQEEADLLVDAIIVADHCLTICCSAAIVGFVHRHSGWHCHLFGKWFKDTRSFVNEASVCDTLLDIQRFESDTRLHTNESGRFVKGRSFEMVKQVVEAAENGKIRCDACPVMCYIADGRSGACDRYANQGGELIR